MIVKPPALTRLVHEIFQAAGCATTEAATIARHLVEANLVGHDSHGVIRVPPYIDWLAVGKVLANQSPQTVLDSGPLAIVDGRFGFGQVMGEAAVQVGIDKARAHGVSVVALRNAGHLGRIGDWPQQAAEAGLISLHFVNTSGGGILVTPFGGTERRLSANPIAAGIPRTGAVPLLIDISTCAIAEGKIRVALHRGAQVPAGAIIDSAGRPTTDPQVFYADPPGAILPFGGHKGYALSLLCEVLAGTLTGGGASDPAVKRVINGMLSVYVDPAPFREQPAFQAELDRFLAFVTSSRRAEGCDEILLPGEPEARCRAERLARGIELDDTTWGHLVRTAERLGIRAAEFVS